MATPPGQGYLFQGFLCIYPRDEARQRVRTAQHIRGEIVSICFVTENILVEKLNRLHESGIRVKVRTKTLLL